MGIAETRARQLMDKLGIEVKVYNLYIGKEGDYAAISTYHHDKYISVTFTGNYIEINRINEYPIKDTILRFEWRGQLTYHKLHEIEHKVKMPCLLIG